MVSRRQQIACLFLLELLHCCLPRVNPPKNDDPTFIAGIVDAHNKVRAGVNPTASNMNYLSWDNELADAAQRWANNCNYSSNPNKRRAGKIHPKFMSVGENMWVGHMNMPISPTEEWAAQANDYDYASRSCSAKCSNYTQVIWAETWKIGCAAAYCRRIRRTSLTESNIVVCYYGPSGDHPGEAPYREGVPCYSCKPGDTCENKLCKNVLRDTVKEPTKKPELTTAQATFVQLQLYSVMLSLTFICLYFVA